MLTRSATLQADQCGIQQIQRHAVPNFADECSANSVFGGCMRPLVESMKLFCVCLGAGFQFSGIDYLVKEPGVPCGVDIKVFRQRYRPLERGWV